MSSKSRSVHEETRTDGSKSRISHRDFNSGEKEERSEVIR